MPHEVQDILNAVYDESAKQLRTSYAGAASAATGTQKGRDLQEIWNEVFDAATNSIRTVS